MRNSNCYRCGEKKTSMEHFPPRSFFPNRGKGLQLTTVPSCKAHNNDKSEDDIYVLAHICLNTSKNGSNLPFQRFQDSVLKQLHYSSVFKQEITKDSKDLEIGARAYQVDSSRFDNFFDSFVCAIYYDTFKKILNFDEFKIRHKYINFYQNNKDTLWDNLNSFAAEFSFSVSEKEFAKIAETVYFYKTIAPASNTASITILHEFYDSFKVISYLIPIPINTYTII